MTKMKNDNEKITLDISKNKATAEAYNEEIKKKIGSTYRTKRVQLGKSISSLAAELGIGITTISELEKGYNFPKIETVIYIGLCLELEINEIIMLMTVSDNPKVVELTGKNVHEVFNSISGKHCDLPSTIEFEKFMDDYHEKFETLRNITTLNKAGEDIVLEFVNFISSQSKYQAGSAYSKRKNKKKK